MARRVGNREQHVIHHDSLEQMVNRARTYRGNMHAGVSSSVYGGHSLQSACDYVLRGASEEQTREIDKLLQKIDASVHDREKQQWVPSVSGAYPIVPEYLMGMPESMRQRVMQEDDRAPITIYVESSLSASLSALATAKRGAAISALAMRLSEERPTELRLFKTSHTRSVQVCWTVKIDTKPVSAAQCMAVFGTEAFCRMVGWAYLMTYDNSHSLGAINFGFGQPGDRGRADQIREVFGATPHDIVIEAGYAPDESLLQNDPVAWVHRQLEKQRTIEVN